MGAGWTDRSGQLDHGVHGAPHTRSRVRVERHTESRKRADLVPSERAKVRAEAGSAGRSGDTRTDALLAERSTVACFVARASSRRPFARPGSFDQEVPEDRRAKDGQRVVTPT